jgi:hypothetical protein
VTNIATLREIVEDGSHFLDERRTGLVERELESSLIARAKYKVVEVVTGVRRSGKSTLLHGVGRALRQVGRDVHYINFEDDRISPRTSDLSDLSSLLRLGDAVLLIDEPQNMPGWERWVRRMHDRGLKTYVTGSNSRLLGGEFSSALAGRKRQHEVFPFSFTEYLRAKGATDVPSDQRLRLLESYLRNGGFPYPAVSEDQSILKDYREDIIERDVLWRHRITDQRRFRDLVRFLMSTPGIYLSARSVKGFLDISHPTLRKYLEYLEGAYAVLALEKYSRSIKVRVQNPKKVYPIDNGLLLGSDDKGRLLESCVVQHLRRATEEMFYWKDARNREVDIYLPEEKLAIQVVYELDRDNLAREERPLFSAKKMLSASGIVVCMYSSVEGEFPAIRASDVLLGDPMERIRSEIGARGRPAEPTPRRHGP